MLDLFSKKLQSQLDSIGRKSNLSEEDLKFELKSIRRILIEADVNYKVAKDFCNSILETAIDTRILVGLNAGEQVIKLVKDRMLELLEGNNELNLKSNHVIMMVGLQGSGKTTTTGKLALYLSKKKGLKKPLLVACDVYRPAAIDQLKQIGKQLNFEVYSDDHNDVVLIVKNALDYAKQNNFDAVILDTAGRVHVDNEMMDEVKKVCELAKPDETLLVLDGSIGQVAVDVCNEFNSYLDITGLIFTKMDGDSRAGAVFSIKKTTGIDIKFLGVGEKLNELDEFNPNRIVGKILGEGDILGLIQKAEEFSADNDLEADASKLMEGKFDLNDFLKQMNMMKKMGGFSSILSMMPGINKIDMSKFDEKQIVISQAIIESMTMKERTNPNILNGARRIRIAKGSGTRVQDVNKLIKGYEQSKKMMKMMKNKDLSKLNINDFMQKR